MQSIETGSTFVHSEYGEVVVEEIVDFYTEIEVMEENDKFVFEGGDSEIIVVKFECVESGRIWNEDLNTFCGSLEDF